jgi:regulator of protease activity HflC (stomatin/prohibitin superfamily)
MYFLLQALLWTVVIGIVAWVVCSIRFVGPAQVGVMLYCGKPTTVHQSGPVIVPWVPFRFSGLRVWELMRLDKGLIPFNYEGKKDSPKSEQVWSKDHQQLFLEISGFVRIPYNEPASLVQMIEANVPRDPVKLVEWLREEVVAGIRNIMSKYNMEYAIAEPNLDLINTEAQKFFLRPGGLFERSRICGGDPTNFDPGTGEVVLRIDQVLPTEEVRKSMGRPAVARYDAEAAKSLAEVVATQSGGPINILMDKWIKELASKLGISVADATQQAHRNGSWDAQLRLYKDLILANSDNLAVVRNEIGSPDGGPLPAGLQYISVGNGGGGLGIMANGRRRDKGDNRGDPKDGNKPKTKEERRAQNQADADQIMKGG